MTPLDAMQPGLQPRLDGARKSGEPVLPGPGFDAMLDSLEIREPPPDAAAAVGETEAAAGPAPRPSVLGALLASAAGPAPAAAGATPATTLRPGGMDLAALMEQAAGRAPTPGATGAPQAAMPAPKGTVPAPQGAASTPVGGAPAGLPAAAPSVAASPAEAAASAPAMPVSRDAAAPTLPQPDARPTRTPSTRSSQGATARALPPQREAQTDVASDRTVSELYVSDTAVPERDAPEPDLADPTAPTEELAVTPDADPAPKVGAAPVPAPGHAAAFAPVAWPVRVDLAAPPIPPTVPDASARVSRSAAEPIPATATPLPALAQAVVARAETASVQLGQAGSAHIDPAPAGSTQANSAPAASDIAARPVATLVAQETHFAPVSSPSAGLRSSGAAPVGPSDAAASPGLAASPVRTTLSEILQQAAEPLPAVPLAAPAAEPAAAAPVARPDAGSAPVPPDVPPAARRADPVSVAPIPVTLALIVPRAGVATALDVPAGAAPLRGDPLPAAPSIFPTAPAPAGTAPAASAVPHDPAPMTPPAAGGPALAVSPPEVPVLGPVGEPSRTGAISDAAPSQVLPGAAPTTPPPSAAATQPPLPAVAATQPAMPPPVQAGRAADAVAGAATPGRSVRMPAGQGGDASSETEPTVTSEEAPGVARMADRLRQGEAGRHEPSPTAKLTPQARLSQAGLSPEAGSTATAERRAEGPVEPAAGASASVQGAPPAPTALPAATLRQIADAVTTGAASLPDTASLRAGAAAAALSAAAQAEGPVRLMTLQLRPAELGQVLVRMRLQDGRLEMSLRAEREETADLLRRDGGLLSALVREAGYQPDLVTVQAGRPPGQEAPPQGGQSLPDFAGGQQQGGATPDQPARRTPDAPEEGGRRSMEQRDEAHHGDRDRGGLYL